MLRLKANKTSLYKLVHYYEPMPKMRKTTFTKAPRTPDYWMEWMDACGLWCKAFLSVCAGKPLLSITKYDCDEEVSRKVHDLSIADLRERDMVEERRTACGTV